MFNTPVSLVEQKINRVDRADGGNGFVGDKYPASQFTVQAQSLLLHPDGMLDRQAMQHQAVTSGYFLTIEEFLGLAANKPAVDIHAVQLANNVLGKAFLVFTACADSVCIQGGMLGEWLEFAGAEGKRMAADYKCVAGQLRQIIQACGGAAQDKLGAMVQDHFPAASMYAKDRVDADGFIISQPGGEREQPLIQRPGMVHGQCIALQFKLNI